MKATGWGMVAYGASLYLAAAFLAGESPVVWFAAVLISAATLSLPQRTGPFAFLAFVGTIVAFSSRSPVTAGFGPRQVLDVVAVATYLFAAGECDFLRHGISVGKPKASSIRPAPGPAILRGVWIGLAASLAGAAVLRPGLEPALLVFWAGLAILVVGNVVFGLLEIHRGGRALSRLVLQETFLQSHRSILRLVHRLGKGRR